MLGVPSADAEHLYELASIVYPGGTENSGLGPGRLRLGHAAAVELQEYFTPLIEQRARRPHDDLISMMAEGERRGAFTREECVASIMILLDAGHSTTLSLISKGTHTLIRHPEQWDLLRSDPEGLGACATEECLRYDPSLKLVPARVAKQDVEFGGKEIGVGDAVAYAIASANRDPRVFTSPDTFDITRSPNPHIAFGGGIHHCLGSALARTEGQEAFKALARNFPRLRIEDDVEYVPNIFQHMLTELRVSWD
jgi:pimeloyl-[acyl-carrier protein] synthase